MKKNIQGWTLFGFLWVTLFSGGGAILMFWLSETTKMNSVPWGFIVVLLSVVALIYAVTKDLLELKSSDLLDGEEKYHLGVIVDSKLARLKTVNVCIFLLLVPLILLVFSGFYSVYVSAFVGSIIGAAVASLFLVYEEQKEVKQFEAKLKNRVQERKKREELLKAMQKAKSD